jgi:hypothetical protein
MGSLEDQLKQWKKASGADAKASTVASPASKSPSSSPSSRRAQKKKPLLQTIRRDEAPKPAVSPAPAAAPLNDADLFAAAVEGVSEDAVLDKFSAAPAVRVRGQALQPTPPKDDGALFTEFVGVVQPKGTAAKKR